MSEERTGKPRVFEALGGAALAATAVAAAMTLYSFSRDGVIYPGVGVAAVLIGLPLAMLHAFCLGLPAYLLLRRTATLRWWNSALGGVGVALVPATVLTIIGGRNPASLLQSDPGIVLLLGTAGLAGGLAFRGALGRTA